MVNGYVSMGVQCKEMHCCCNLLFFRGVLTVEKTDYVHYMPWSLKSGRKIRQTECIRTYQGWNKYFKIKKSAGMRLNVALTFFIANLRVPTLFH